MKIAVISHSQVHPRQYLFFGYMSRSDIKILQIYPSSWGPLKREGGFPVSFEGNMALYTFPPAALNLLQDFKPDIIYYQGEWWSRQGLLSLGWAQQLNSKFSIFCWENLRQVESEEQKAILRGAAVVVCGNWEARSIVREYAKWTVRIPQVGLDTDLFKPMNVEKKYDLLYIGRPAPEKGLEYVRRVAEKLGLTYSFGEGYTPYTDLPRVYNSAKVFVMFSYAIPEWKEQFLPYASAEALSCGLPVVSSNTGSIPEWGGQAPMVVFVNEKDEKGLERTLKGIFSQPIPKSEMGREWVRHNLSKEVVAQQLLEVFERL